MYSRLMFATTLCMMLVSCEGRYHVECTVNVYAHAFNLNNQYITLL